MLYEEARKRVEKFKLYAPVILQVYPKQANSAFYHESVDFPERLYFDLSSLLLNQSPLKFII
jgi:hypothetical protein